MALADGLRARMADLERPMALAVAKELLRDHITKTFNLPLDEGDRGDDAPDETGTGDALTYM